MKLLDNPCEGCRQLTRTIYETTQDCIDESQCPEFITYQSQQSTLQWVVADLRGKALEYGNEIFNDLADEYENPELEERMDEAILPR